jgi:hypothetical protein
MCRRNKTDEIFKAYARRVIMATPKGVRAVNENIIQPGRGLIFTTKDTNDYKWSDIPNGALFVDEETGAISVKIKGESNWTPLTDLVKADGTIMIARDSKIMTEVFTVKEIDLENMEFKYEDAKGEYRHSVIMEDRVTGKNAFVFKLEEGDFLPFHNLLTASINDTLERSAASGGLIEINNKKIALFDDLQIDDEVTIRYAMRIAIGNPYPRTYMCFVEPEDPEEGDFWLDLNPSPHKEY